VLATGALIGSADGARISSATRADYAEADAVVLAGTGHEGQTYALAGDEAWTLGDLAAEISRQSGRTIPYQDLPAEEYTAVLMSVGLPEALAQAIAGWDVAAAQGALFDDSHQLSRLIGRPTTPHVGRGGRGAEGGPRTPAGRARTSRSREDGRTSGTGGSCHPGPSSQAVPTTPLCCRAAPPPRPRPSPRTTPDSVR
jgi:hypothetical protein